MQVLVLCMQHHLVQTQLPYPHSSTHPLHSSQTPSEPRDYLSKYLLQVSLPVQFQTIYCALNPPTPLQLALSEPQNSSSKIPANHTASNDNQSTKDKSDQKDVKDKSERHTFCAEEHRQPIIDMVEQHFCTHPLIPSYSHPTPTGIHEWAVQEIYGYCVANDLCEVWVYLWENWYCQGRWELWAWANYEEIPVLKTTMIMESQ